MKIRILKPHHPHRSQSSSGHLLGHVGALLRQLPAQARRLDIRRPAHAATVGLLLAGIIAPIANWAATNEQYRQTPAMAAVTETPAPHLEAKLQYDAAREANVFNAAGETTTQPATPDKLAASAGAGGSRDSQLYTATLPDDPTRGVTIHDNINDLTIGFRPQVALLNGRATNGQVVYPLKSTAGQLVFTPKGNGLKEDIVLASAPASDTAEFTYQLTIPDTVQPRLNADGSIGFYAGDPELFGNISYASSNDQQLVQKARQNAQKTYLMFSIPAPTIRQTGQGSPTTARFTLSGSQLTVRVTGLTRAHYPLAIDPTFLLTSTSDWVLGSVDDNIDLSVADQVGRQALVGGSTPGWSATKAPNLAYAQFASSLVAYNGYLYLIGGGSSSGSSGTTTNDVRYISLNPTTGALGGSTPTTWTSTSSLLTARQGLVAFGFNGYLYAVGGQDDSGVPITAANSVEYAQITTSGALASNSGCGTGWCRGSALNTARAYPAGAIYQGVLYVMGGTSGSNNATPLATTEWARINGDGTVGSWTQSTSSATGNLTSACSKFAGGAYNGFVYITGGQTSSATVVNTVEYAPIQSDGSLGAWTATTTFPTARRDMAMAINDGYLYVFGGCSGAAEPCASFIADTQYAVINADGSVGQWQKTLNYNSGFNDSTTDYNARMPGGFTSYSNHLYFVGGCSTETATNNCSTQLVGTFITNIDSPGRFDQGVQTIQTTAPYNNNASTVARYAGAATVLNGYLYYISGTTLTSGTYSNVVERALIGTDGTLGTFTTTGNSTVIAQGTDKTGRIGFTLAAYNNKVYLIGGIELSGTGTVDIFQNTIITATQGAAGVLTGWTTEANTLPTISGSATTGIGFQTTVQWHNYIYVIGGRSTATVSAQIFRSQIQANGTLGAWSATTGHLTTGRWAHSGGLWGNYLYVVGGQSSAGAAGTYVSTASGVERLTIGSAGDIAANGTASSFPVSQRYASGGVENGYLYAFGGITSASTASRANIYWSALDPTTGTPSGWSNSNIGNLPSGTAGLATARDLATAITAGGMWYVLGGCTSGSAIGAATYDDCTTLVSTAHTTEAYLANDGGTGQTGAFATATALPAATADHAVVAYNGYLYKIGGCTGYTSGACTSGSNSTEIRQATISPSAAAPGTLGSWSAPLSLALPVGLSLEQAVAYNGYLYVIGGRSDTTAANTTVYYTPITNTGGLGASWSNADLPAGTGRNAFGATVMNGYLYVAGGDNGSGTKKGDVYYAQLSTANGSLATAWATTSSFTTTRSSLSLVGYNGRVYVIGGTDGTNALTDVQFASQNSDGSLGSFGYTIDVPRGMIARQAVAANGYMYFIGDEGDGTEIDYADINADGTLGTPQRSTSAMAGAHAHGAAAWFDGYFYVTGGCTVSASVCTTPLTSDEYAGQQAISRTGHYSKLFNTQVDTAPTQLLIGGAVSGPGSAVEFRFQTASSSDPVLGVAQVIRPVIFGQSYNVQALNSSGTNVGVAFNYLYILTLDDSRSATFPDVPNTASGFGQTAVTDITLYYHANPARRLRHGASFTNTGCNPTPANGCILDTAP